MVRAEHGRKIHHALTNWKTILNGLTRGWIKDHSMKDWRAICERSFLSRHDAALGLVMPSNSPAVNSLWLPAIA